MEQLLFLIIALINGVLILYPILRYAPIRDNWCKRGPSIRLLGNIYQASGRRFPSNPRNLWAKALDCYGTLLLYEYLILQSLGVSVTYSILGFRKWDPVIRTVRPIPSYLCVFNAQVRCAHGQRSLEDLPKGFSKIVEQAISNFNGMALRNEGRPLVG
jgi:hypothetical protein